MMSQLLVNTRESSMAKNPIKVFSFWLIFDNIVARFFGFLSMRSAIREANKEEEEEDMIVSYLVLLSESID